MAKKKAKAAPILAGAAEYDGLVARISSLLEQGRRATVSASNAILTATYWNVGRQIVEYEQGGKARAEYGEVLLKRLGQDLTGRYGRGYSRQGLQKMRTFYLGWEICPTLSGKLQVRVKCPTLSGKSDAKKLQTQSAISQPLSRLKFRSTHRCLSSKLFRYPGRTMSS